MEITAQMIKDAYYKMKIQPIQRQWIESDSHGVTCACGMSVLYASETSIEKLMELVNSSSVMNGLEKQFNVSLSFLSGFMDAFDEHGLNSHFPQYIAGYAIGKETIELVFPETEADNANQTV